jgi:hypothetical protein
MKKLSHWMILFGVILVFVAVSAFTMPGELSSFDTGEYPFYASFHSAETIAAISQQQGEFLPPTPKTNPCLHCHIAGQEVGAWTPLYRWLSFGAMGLIFLFGVTRSLSTWNTREQWKPVGARISGLVNTTDPLGKQLDKPAPNWMRRSWYYLGGVALFFFIVQGVSGLVNAAHLDPLVFDPETDTHVQLIFSIKSIHWGVGVFLLLALLVFNLIGTLMNSEQRSYWTTMLIITGVFGIPAIVQLTLGYLDPEMVIPSGHLFALHAVLISALVASIAAMYFIVTYKPSEE